MPPARSFPPKLPRLVSGPTSSPSIPPARRWKPAQLTRCKYGSQPKPAIGLRAADPRTCHAGNQRDQNRVYLLGWSGKGLIAQVGSSTLPVPDALAFSHDGHLLAVGQGDGTVQLWDIENPAHPVALGSPFADPRSRGTGMTTLAFSSNGSVLATQNGPYTYHGIQSVGVVRLWNIDHPIAPQLMSAALSSQGPMAFSPAGLTLATIRSDYSVQLWDVADPSHPKATGTPLFGHTSNVLAMTFSPNGKSSPPPRLTTVCGYGTSAIPASPQLWRSWERNLR